MDLKRERKHYLKLQEMEQAQEEDRKEKQMSKSELMKEEKMVVANRG